MRHWARLGILVVGMGLAGCQQYRPLPLDAPAVEKALMPPSERSLVLRAKTLRHPILRPITLNVRDGLSPDEAAVLAVLVNPSLRVARDRRGLADAQVLQAGLLPNPQLSAALEPPVGGSTAGTVNAFGFGLNWDITKLISRSAHVEEASSKRTALDMDIAWREWQVAEAAKTATYRLVGLEKRKILTAEMDRRLEKNLALVRRAVRDGQMTERELSAAETASYQAHTGQIELKKRIHQQRLEMNRLLGTPSEVRIRLAKGIELPWHVEPPMREQLLKGLERRRLDLVALHRGYESQEAAVRAAILEQFPRINIGVNEARDTGNVLTIGVGVSISLPVFDRNQGKIALERATRKMLLDEYVSRVFQARSNITALLDNIRSIGELLQAARSSEPSLRRLVQTYRAAVRDSQVDVLSYYTVWNRLTEKRIEILRLRQQLVENRIALELETGLYRLESIARPPSMAPPSPRT